MIGDARVLGDQVKCWHCRCTLGQIVRNIEEGYILAAQPLYRPDDVPPPIAATGIRTVLVITNRTRDRLARTGLYWTRRKSLDEHGAARVERSRFCVLPVLMSCWKPDCGEVNRVELTSVWLEAQNPPVTEVTTRD